MSAELLNCYDKLLDRLMGGGIDVAGAVTLVVERYLGGKPQSRGKQKVTQKERDLAFWTSQAVDLCNSAAWRSNDMVLALAKYLNQEAVAAPGLLERLALHTPESLIRAVRYAGLVLKPKSPRRLELGSAANVSREIAELCSTLEIFEQAHRERIDALENCKRALEGLAPFELLIYASLHAFENWVPRGFAEGDTNAESDSDTQTHWDAVNDLLLWKLSSSPDTWLRLSEEQIGWSLRAHLSPVLFPSNSDSPSSQARAGFQELLAAQIELNSFVARSADAFSYDDGIRFVRHGQRLEIVQIDPGAGEAWRREEDKLRRLHGYWFYRAMDEFADSEHARSTIGRPENHEANRLAFIRAIRSRLRLTEVYGLAESVTADSGEKVDLFRALLSLELMSAFYLLDYLAPFAEHLKETGNPLHALNRLAMNGLLSGNQNRFPLTWSDRTAKVENIKPWTVSAEHPGGSARMAGAILDFWTSDWTALAAKLRQGRLGLVPELFERPVLRLGSTLLQLPWIVAVQNNSTAAINNLRRLGARRSEAGIETAQIERRLGALFESRGYGVLANWQLPAGEEEDAGEVDLICVRDGTVLVLELKSTYLRRSKRDAFMHATTTLRKAGLQLRRNVEAIRRGLSTHCELSEKLGLTIVHGVPEVRGWIVDTSIECDHQRFSGFLKVSLEEVLIALRDDRQLLSDPEGLFSAKSPADVSLAASTLDVTLYPEGFTAVRFHQVIENQMVWDRAGTHPDRKAS